VTVAGPLFVTATSALWLTVVFAVELLFEGSVSKLSDATVAVFAIDDALPLLRTSVNCELAPLVSAVNVQVTLPFVPGVGVPHPVGGVPLSFVSETNVVPGGRSSVRDTSFAVLGPAFETVIV
jgi:hypothetical protein